MSDSLAHALELFDRAWAKLVGQAVARDLPGARRLLAEAHALGDDAALLLLATLTANGTGGPADWPAAMALLAQGASLNEVAREQLRLLEAMKLTRDGDPVQTPRGQVICDDPEVRVAHGFFSTAECRHVAGTALRLLKPAMIADPTNGRDVPHPVRRSDAAVLGPVHEDLVIQALNRRVAALTGTAPDQGEPLTVLRYRPGQEYRTHHDALPNEPNQRVRTVIVYLNDGYAGGATRFHAIGLDHPGRAGDALVFDNLRADGSPHPLARHSGLPVLRGAKWIATRWIRARPLDPWDSRTDLT